MARFLKLFTTLPMDEVARLAALQGAEINEAKKVLATEAPRSCTAATRPKLRPKRRARPSSKARSRPVCRRVDISRPMSSRHRRALRICLAGLVKSNGEARRQIQGGGLKINDVAVTDEKAKVGTGDLTSDGVIKLSIGKRNTCYCA